MNRKSQIVSKQSGRNARANSPFTIHHSLTIGIDATPATRATKTGTERYAEALILEFAQMKLPHQFVLYSRFAPTGALAKLPRNFTWKVMPFPLLWSQLRLAWEFLMHPKAVDVMFFPAHVMPLIHPRRSVITLHDIGFEHFPELYGDRPIGPRLWPLRLLVSAAVRLMTGFRYHNTELDYHRWATRFALAHASAVLTVSESTKQDIVTHFSPLQPPIVTHLGVESYDSRVTTHDSRAAAKLQPYILFVGRIEAKKNVVTLIEAFGQFAREDEAVQLVLVGLPGHGYAAIADAIAAQPANIRARVHEVGYVDKWPWLQHASVFAFPSAFEGFGLPPLEAMRVKIPVVAANGSSIPEVVGDAALLVDTYDVEAWALALKRALTNAKLREQLITKGIERVRGFTWQRTAIKTLQLLESVAKRGAA